MTKILKLLKSNTLKFRKFRYRIAPEKYAVWTKNHNWEKIAFVFFFFKKLLFETDFYSIIVLGPYYNNYHFFKAVGRPADIQFMLLSNKFFCSLGILPCALLRLYSTKHFALNNKFSM